MNKNLKLFVIVIVVMISLTIIFDIALMNIVVRYDPNTLGLYDHILDIIVCSDEASCDHEQRHREDAYCAGNWLARLNIENWCSGKAGCSSEFYVTHQGKCE